MNCREAEELLLDSLDERVPDHVRRVLEGHLSTCTSCSAFAASARAVDAQLTAALLPAVPPPSIATNLRTRIRRERRTAFNENLPDLIHLTGCGVSTILCAALLPVDPTVSLAAGVGFTCVSYVFMAVVRWSLEAAGQPDW